MARKKPYSILGYDDNTNDPLTFDPISYRQAIENKKLELTNQKNRTISDSAIYRMICLALYPDDYDAMVKSMCDKLKNWKSERNGPSDIKEVRRIEEFLNCTLLTPLKGNNQADTERTNSNMHTSNVTSPEELAAAKEAYGILYDLICAQHELMHRYKTSNKSPLMVATCDCIPSYFPSFGDIYYKLRKLRFNLSYDIISKTISLAREIYGFWSSEYETFQIERTLDMADKTDEFEHRVIFSGEDTGDETTQFFAWMDFANSLAEEYCETLDGIFSDYLQ